MVKDHTFALFNFWTLPLGSYIGNLCPPLWLHSSLCQDQTCLWSEGFRWSGTWEGGHINLDYNHSIGNEIEMKEENIFYSTFRIGTTNHLDMLSFHSTIRNLKKKTSIVIKHHLVPELTTLLPLVIVLLVWNQIFLTILHHLPTPWWQSSIILTVNMGFLCPFLATIPHRLTPWWQPSIFLTVTMRFSSPFLATIPHMSTHGDSRVPSWLSPWGSCLRTGHHRSPVHPIVTVEYLPDCQRGVLVFLPGHHPPPVDPMATVKYLLGFH